MTNAEALEIMEQAAANCTPEVKQFMAGLVMAAKAVARFCESVKKEAE